MARLNFIRGTLRGRVGQFVGSSWRGKEYIKTFTAPGNPRTEKQVGVRSVFAHIGHIAKAINQTILKKYTFPKPQKHSEYNHMIKINQSMIAEKVWDATKLKIFDGSLFNPGCLAAEYVDEGGLDKYVRVVWDNSDGGDDSFIAVIVIYNDSTGEVIGYGEEGWTGSETIAIVGLNPPKAGEKVYAYLAFVKPPAANTAEAGQVSKTSCRQVTGI